MADHTSKNSNRQSHKAYSQLEEISLIIDQEQVRQEHAITTGITTPEIYEMVGDPEPFDHELYTQCY